LGATDHQAKDKTGNYIRSEGAGGKVFERNARSVEPNGEHRPAESGQRTEA
jgi:hypothetical protein